MLLAKGEMIDLDFLTMPIMDHKLPEITVRQNLLKRLQRMLLKKFDYSNEYKKGIDVFCRQFR